MSDQCQRCGKRKCRQAAVNHQRPQMLMPEYCLASMCHGHAEDQPQPELESRSECEHGTLSNRLCELCVGTQIPSRSQLRREALQKGETMPTFDEQQRAEASDLTTLIERISDPEYMRDHDPLNLPGNRDEIVLALRLLRVLRHPDAWKWRFFQAGLHEEAMQSAERILGYGGGE